MVMTHLLIELFCDKGKYGRHKKQGLDTPCKGSFVMREHCLACPLSSYTYCPDELCLSDSAGCVDLDANAIGFGGDMIPNENEEFWVARWHEIAKEKIAEAYDEYMHELKQGQ